MNCPLCKSITHLRDGQWYCQRCDTTIVDDRTRFETWVKTEHPERWPNPHTSETFVRKDGGYYNLLLHAMWEAWIASQGE